MLAGLILTLLLMRKQDPVDDDEPAQAEPPPAAPAHRPLGRHPHWGLPFGSRGPPAT